MKQYFLYILGILYLLFITGCATSQDKTILTEKKKTTYEYIPLTPTSMPEVSTKYTTDSPISKTMFNAESSSLTYDWDNPPDSRGRMIKRDREELRRNDINSCLSRSSESEKNGCYSRSHY